VKVLLIVPATGYYRSALSNPLGVLSIATYLKKNGYDVKLFDRNVEKTNINKLIKSFNPDIIGISVMSSRCLKDAIRVSKTVKRYKKMLVWGGQIPTMNTELCFSCKYIDYIIMGEGELTWLEFAGKTEKSESPNEIDGIAYKENGQIVITKCRDFADLKELPLIDWTLVKPKSYYQKFYYSDKMLYLFSSKGCPFNCTFCGNRGYHRCTHRKRPADMVIQEIENLVKNYGMDAVYFTDEEWCVNKEDAYEFCVNIKAKNLPFVWGCDSRIGQYTREELQMMYDAGCRWILVGIESGSKSILDKIHKNINIENVEENIKNCIEIGITPLTTFIIGFPGETVEEIKKTVNLALRVRSKLVQINHYFPTPGSDLEKEIINKGQYEPPKSLKEAEKVIATDTLGQNFSDVPSKDLRVIRCFFNWEVFTGKNTINHAGSFAFAKGAIYDVFNAITKRGIWFFFVGFSTAGWEFLYVFWHVVAYPGVRKKYGLYTKNKQ
jgi:anaerobic magnesium-protoporphyrin IX monomethyl ester cyclase